MNLGETIYKLRISKHMSQGDLADTLEVSRQSISKWETNSSVPELDKLIKLSEIFGVSLDELVLNKSPQDAPQPQVITPVVSVPSSSQKTAGIILLCFAGFMWLTITLLGDILSGLVFASPFLACGLICLFSKKNAGLWCAWTLFLLVDLYLRFATGVNWRLAFRAFQYSLGLTVHVIVAWGQLFCLIILSLVTIVRFWKEPLMTLKKNLMFSGITWISWGITYLTVLIPEVPFSQNLFLQFFLCFVDSARSVLFVSAIVFSIRAVVQRMGQKK